MAISKTKKAAQGGTRSSLKNGRQHTDYRATLAQKKAKIAARVARQILCPQAMDIETLLKLRSWLEKALEKRGAGVTGSGFGCGQADVCFEFDGARCTLTLRPDAIAEVEIGMEDARS